MSEYSKSDLKILQAFGAAVRAKRDALGWLQEELAERAGLHRTYIGGVEQGRRNLSLLNIVRIAEALGISSTQLINTMLSI